MKQSPRGNGRNGIKIHVEIEALEGKTDSFSFRILEEGRRERKSEDREEI